jgi:hypothetical protein
METGCNEGANEVDARKAEEVVGRALATEEVKELDPISL